MTEYTPKSRHEPDGAMFHIYCHCHVLLILFHLHGTTSGILIAFGGALIIAMGESSVKVSDRTGSIIGLTFALAAVGARSMKIVIMDVLLAPKALSVEQKVFFS